MTVMLRMITFVIAVVLRVVMGFGVIAVAVAAVVGALVVDAFTIEFVMISVWVRTVIGRITLI